MRRDRYRYSQLAIAQLVERRTVDVNYDVAILRSMVRIRLARASVLCFNFISDNNIVIRWLFYVAKLQPSTHPKRAEIRTKIARDSNFEANETLKTQGSDMP